MSPCIVPKNTRTDREGYRMLKHRGRIWRMHRLMYTWCVEDIPEGMVIAHRCNNKGCINPEHLYVCTREQNSTDAARDGLYRTGEANPKWNPTLEQARQREQEILYMYDVEGHSQEYIGKCFGVSQPRIGEIIRNSRHER